MSRLADHLLGLTIHLLPRQARRRYAAEFEADLASLPRLRRLGYAVSTVLGAPRLRWEVLHSLAGRTVPSCFVGMHHDRTFRPNPESSWILARECVRCHRIRDTRQYAPRREVNNLPSWYSASGGS